MDSFKRELRDLLTRYPQVESVTYKTAETITKDTFLDSEKPTSQVETPGVASTVLSALEQLKRVGQENKDKML